MTREKVLLGQKGEKIAKNYLLENNYKILDQNFKFRNGEIDLIASNKDFLVFIEVKTRSNAQYGSPEYSITKKKRAAISRTAEYYLYKKNIENMDCRIDVITILFDNKECFKLQHYENI